MADAPHRPDLPDLPEAVAAPKSGSAVRLVWLIPLVAALVGGWLAVKAVMDKGPEITITFEAAEGLEAGKTKLKYKDVEVGLVKTVALSPDASRVIVTAELVKEAKGYLLDDTRFWVVRPRISGGTVTGLGTLLSGSYVGMDIGRSGKAKREFVGLNVPPVISTDTPGKEFILHGKDIGSLDIGSPIYFRRLQAGQVAGYDLDGDGKGIKIKIFVNAPYDKFVTENTRFWQASGVGVTLDSSGVKIETESVVAMLVGGLAFETPAGAVELQPAEEKTNFSLFANRTEALKNPETDVIKTVMIYNESVRGLAPGAPVEFRGIEIGNVTAIRVEVNSASQRINILVEADLYPMRLRARSAGNSSAPILSGAQRRDFIGGLVARGMRAQLRSGNLLTGQLFVTLDFFKEAPAAKLRLRDNMLEFPTMQSNLAELQETIAAVAVKLKNFPLEEVGADLKQTLQSATRMMQRIDTELTPEARDALADARKTIASVDNVLKPESPLSQDAREAMREIGRAAAAFRVLADYLERHPEALVSGKKDDRKDDKKEDKK
jgi:paraquat-inducible protein B